MVESIVANRRIFSLEVRMVKRTLAAFIFISCASACSVKASPTSTSIPEQGWTVPFMEFCRNRSQECGELLMLPNTYYPTPTLVVPSSSVSQEEADKRNREAVRQHSCATTVEGINRYYQRQLPESRRDKVTATPAPCPEVLTILPTVTPRSG